MAKPRRDGGSPLPEAQASGADVIGLADARPDLVDDTRARARRSTIRNGGAVPTLGHAIGCSATRHDIQAVQKAGTDEAAAVDVPFEALPMTDKLLDNPHMLAEGRVVMDMHLVEVKTPAESKGPADLDDGNETIPGDTLFTPADESGCPFTTG